MTINSDMPIWSSDVPISLPESGSDPILVPMYGFGFSQYGFFHDISPADAETLRTPTYAPVLPPGEEVYDDGEL